MLRILCLSLLVAFVSSQRFRAVSAPLGVSNYLTGGLQLAPVSTGETFAHEDREWAKPGTAITREGLPAGTNLDGNCDWSDQWANTWMKGWQGNWDNWGGDWGKLPVEQPTAVADMNTNEEVVVNEAPIQRVQFAPLRTPVRDTFLSPIQRIAAAPIRRVVAAPKYLRYRKLRTHAPLQRPIQYAPLQQVIARPLRQVVQVPLRQVIQTPVRQLITTPVRQVVGAPLERVITTPSQQFISTPIRQVVNVPQSGQLVPVSQRIVVQRGNVQELVSDRSLNHFNYAPETLVLGTPTTYTTRRQQRVLTELPNHTLYTRKPSQVISIAPKPFSNAPTLRPTQNTIVQKVEDPIVQKAT